ncbi:von Willebrand factor type A [Solidesulfovibrio fructosivorans JJ]]|uniref:von Willebrand factor type A n=1 Tax=Solidesulfovibrio fructosivorans JJ] TaxID=596151 RepID=E1JTI7_SOLFR|nr:VWA domain-containing protein [Solidesulfovibrio fructosivorans]EFL52447.1 von Willebrand factor type A [Solidesulfovibrio fructosivorans JJ]]
MLTLARPEVLALAALVPLALVPRLVSRRGALEVADVGPALATGKPPLAAMLPMACRLLALWCVILALAGPRLVTETSVYRGRGVDIMLAVDLSESMAALDMPLPDRTVSRLEAVAQAAARFAADRPGDRIGLVAFGSRAYVVLPPTDDRAALTQALSRLSVGAAGRRTAMGDAVGLAVKQLDRAPGLARLVVVFGDGLSNAGEVRPVEAAKAAAARGIAVFTVGVGGDGPAPFLVNHPLLGQEIVRENAAVDTAALTELAALSGGAFFRAEDAPALAQAVAAVSKRTASDMKPVPTVEKTPFAPLAAALAICLLTLSHGLSATRFLRLP